MDSLCSTLPDRIPGSSKAHQCISLLLLAGLLFLRIPFLGGVIYFHKALPDWAGATYEIGTYVLTAFLIWWESDRLVN